MPWRVSRHSEEQLRAALPSLVLISRTRSQEPGPSERGNGPAGYRRRVGAFQRQGSARHAAPRRTEQLSCAARVKRTWRWCMPGRCCETSGGEDHARHAAPSAHDVAIVIQVQGRGKRGAWTSRSRIKGRSLGSDEVTGTVLQVNGIILARIATRRGAYIPARRSVLVGR